MIDYSSVLLKTSAYSSVYKDYKNNKLSHTYLLISEDMEFSKQFAKTMAKLIINIEENSNHFIKLNKDIHPDCIIFGENEKISTEKAVNISNDVFIRPYEADQKVYILLNMQDANEETQNKLLKTIEEPPANAYFILCSTSEKSLLQTVLSRSKKIELDLIDSETIESLLKTQGIDDKQAKICSECSHGVVSIAYKMATDKAFIEMYQNIFDCLLKMNSSRDVLKYSYVFSQKNINKQEFAEVFMLLIRDIMMIKSANENLIKNKHRLNELKTIAQSFSFEALCKIIDYCLQLKEDLVYNTNINMVIDEFLLKVVEVKVKCK